ncbi:MAG: tetratricopeptide repeat protein [Acidobacteriota bacterium]|nr:tetratricopeptide repeat protein [Acidobacteriota bacterium]
MLTFIVIAILFGITGILVKQFNARERSLGRQWYAQGEKEAASGNSADAILAFRTALYHAQANTAYQLRLAQSLVDSGRVAEARSYLLRLWESNPADGPVNLQLARLAMRTGDITEVIRYYHSAIDGVWPPESGEKPRTLRKALCEYLIDHNHRTEALAELLVLSNETPDSAPLRTEVAALFLKAQDYDVALEQFRHSLRLSRRQAAAWAGAGKAAFMMGNYEAARDYLGRALIENSKDKESASLLSTANQVIAIDPFNRRVPASTRRGRAIEAFGVALARLEACAKSRNEELNASNPQSGLSRLYAAAVKMKPIMREHNLQRNPDLLDSGMSLVFEIEQSTARDCGAPTGMNLALLLIGQRSGGAG